MAIPKKDRLSRKMYKRLKEHPLTRSPIALLYASAIVLIVIVYIIYLIAKQSV